MPWFRFDEPRPTGSKPWLKTQRVRQSWFNLPSEAAALERAQRMADTTGRPVTFKQVPRDGG
jgi:hypothetical protein